MKTRGIGALLLAALLLTIVVGQAASVSGAAYTTFNPWVDGLFKEVCKNSIINCNLYGAKPDVWINGGPAANGLGPDGQYFFAVLVPGGQPNPNDGGPKNLSDDYDAYTKRIFTVTDGEISYYGGTHDQDSGNTLDANRKYCKSPRGCTPDGKPPLIRLYPYADTWNPGGVYILAVCYIGEDGSQYPVVPRDCKYDAFKVKEPNKASLRLSGLKFYDRNADGKADLDEPGLAGWKIHIVGTGFLGEAIDVIVTTGAHGYWDFQKDYTYSKSTPLVDADLTVCELMPSGNWMQTYPDPACYDLVIPPAALADVDELDFGNVCFGEANFDTKGYWHNKNGLSELTTADRDYVNGLDPYDAPSDYFGAGDEPFDGAFQNGDPVPAAFDNDNSLIWGAGTWQAEVSHFLVDPNAGGGGGDREQLAQQLLAFIFNVRHRLDNPDAVIKVDGGWMSAQAVVDAAVAAWASPTTDDDKVWEPILDGLNNNDAVPFIHPDPCEVVYP
jgi:hypothetical protein